MKKVVITLENDAPGLGVKGERVSLDLTPSDVREASEMDDAIFGYKNFSYRADEASPVILRDHQTDKYRTFSSDNAFLRVSVKGDARGNISEVDPGSALSTYAAEAKFLGSFVPNSTSSEASYDMKLAAAHRIKNALDLDREVDVWSLIGTATNLDSSVRIAKTTNENWNAGSSSTPITDLQNLLKNSAQPISDIFMNRIVADALLNNSQTTTWLAKMLGSRGADTLFSSVDGKSDFQFPSMPPIRVVESQSTATPGGSRSYCLGNVVIGVSKPPGVPTSGEEVATSYTFRKRGMSGNGYQSREEWLGTRGLEGGYLVIGGTEDVPKVTSTIAGGIIHGTVIA